MRIEHLLKEEIEKEFKELERMDTGSESYKVAVDGLTKLVDRVIEIEKTEAELREKVNSRESDNNLKLQQAKDDKINRIAGHAINVAGIVLPIAVTIWGTRTSLKFEETGTVTTLMGRGFIQKLLPKMK